MAFVTTVNVQCNKPEEAPLSLLIFAFVSQEQCKYERRLKFEPNDDFKQATCLEKNIKSETQFCSIYGTTVYPQKDKDFFIVTMNSGSIRLYISSINFIPPSEKVSIQFFDKNQNLIFDPEDTQFNTVSLTILENRRLTKDDCDPTQCDDFIAENRMIRFDPSIKQIYIKFYPSFPDKFQEGTGSLQLLSTSIDRTLDPSRYGGTPLLQGDIKPCN
jgi:hypothetical protein